jgi:parvulin-like peptidyl-prolyl isomerase
VSRTYNGFLSRSCVLAARGGLLLAWALFGCHPAKSADPVILTLDDQIVRRSEFESHLQAVGARTGSALTPEVRAALLEPYLEERVVVLLARARGLVAEGATPEREREAVQRLLQESAATDAPVTAEEVAAYYETHREELGRPEMVTVRQIVVPTSNEARDIRRRLQKDPKQFEALAQTRSRAPEASAGGLMGTFARGQLPSELEKAVFDLPPGQASEIVQSPLGHHVLRLDARQEARLPSREEAQEEVRRRLVLQKSETRVREFVRGLLARAQVNHEAAKQTASP